MKKLFKGAILITSPSIHCLGQQGENLLSGLVQFPAAGLSSSLWILVLIEESLLRKPCLLGHPSRRKNASPYVFSRRQPGLTDSNRMMHSKKCSIHGRIMSGGKGERDKTAGRDGCQGRTWGLPGPTAGQPQVRLGTSTGSEKFEEEEVEHFYKRSCRKFRCVKTGSMFFISS